MKANTALCFLLGGCALALHGLSAADTPRVRRLTGILAGTLVALIALATLIEYHAGWDLVIDELLFRDPVLGQHAGLYESEFGIAFYIQR